MKLLFVAGLLLGLAGCRPKQPGLDYDKWTKVQFCPGGHDCAFWRVSFDASTVKGMTCVYPPIGPGVPAGVPAKLLTFDPLDPHVVMVIFDGSCTAYDWQSVCEATLDMVARPENWECRGGKVVRIGVKK